MTQPEEHREPTRREWPGVWPGIVVDTNDPLKQGRVKARVPQVYGLVEAPEEQKIPDLDLPWARPAFPVAGPQHGIFAIPEVGDPILILFWGCDPEYPVWIGGWLGTGDAPPFFQSAYALDGTGPKTYLIRTPVGQEFEMRWLQGQQQAVLRTPAGQEFRLTDTPLAGAALTTPGQLDVLVGTLLNLTVGGIATLSIAVLTLAVTAALALTAGGLLALVGAGVTIFTSGAAVAIGTAVGTKKALATSDFVTKFYTHIHIDSMAGATSAPSNVVAGAEDLTANTVAD